MHENRLINETSPYLRQHAHNPVDWYPWSEEALELARQTGKPILLSIGYSACHWCHVMAHESFEDEKTAQLMNDLFINIKVDREERPDLDKIYQLAHQLLTQRGGGWPLTVMLTPDDQTPFFAGTYFPHEPRYGMPGFKQLLQQIAAYFAEHRDEIDDQNRRLQAFLHDLGKNPPADDALNAQPLDLARQQLEQHFDTTHGGFGDAPKFPHPTNLERLLRHWVMLEARGHHDDQVRHMILHTLQAMGRGGIYDHLGGGFFRYSVDAQWMIPHFEKMLYDNGALLGLYAWAWQAFREPTLQRVVTETGDWVMREMQSPAGGYYSTLDADSEGKEGKFYLWTPDQIKTVLDGNETAQWFCALYGLDHPANFEGQWHLHRTHDRPGHEHDLTHARQTLLAVRDQRIHPARDEKILAAWNGLMIKGMASAGRITGNMQFIDSASRALAFIQRELWQNKRLLACHKDQQSRFNAYLDDYAFVLDGVLELLQARWDDSHLAFAIQLADTLLEQFEDTEYGGFFFTSHDHEPLLHRPKSYADDSLPSGNGVAALTLIRLGHMLAETRYVDAAERALKAAWPAMREMPYAHNALLHALEEYLYPPQMVFLRGRRDETQHWQHQLNKALRPRRLVFAIDAGGARLPGKNHDADHPLAYRCDGFACSAPIADLNTLQEELEHTYNNK